SVEMLQVALDKVMDPEALEQLAAAETEAPEMVEAQEAEASAAPVEAAPEAPVAAPVPSPIVAFPDEIPAGDRRRVRKEARAEAEPVLEIEEDDDVLPAKGKKGKKGKKKHRQIYFDEDRGEMVVRRQHRGGPGATWDDDFE
ncbi:MAG: hypothetical protein H3C32_09495, partial [Anaerolineae bacterium]|nr:hypothetical protein [Anaerolineae bacterium]